jgi:uncharacterized membrane protein YeaQ/YmgE (transglycosylase-associated protein family)
MNILAWIVLGLVAGAIAKAIYPGRQGGGILGTILLGVVGAFIGGTLAVMLTTGRLTLATTTVSVPGIILAVLGALIAIFIWHLYHKRRLI